LLHGAVTEQRFNSRVTHRTAAPNMLEEALDPRPNLPLDFARMLTRSADTQAVSAENLERRRVVLEQPAHARVLDRPRPSLTGSQPGTPHHGAAQAILLRRINDLGCSDPNLQVNSALVKV
jgi:hypothetical protein